MDSDNKTMTTKELSAAVTELLAREESRAIRKNRRRRRAARERRERMHAQVDQLYRSIEVIKWCIVGIASVMAVALLVVVIVVMQLRSEAVRIKGEVEKIRGEAEAIVIQIETEAAQIREKLQNPIRTLGGALGGQLDRRIGDAIGIEE